MPFDPEELKRVFGDNYEQYLTPEDLKELGLDDIATPRDKAQPTAEEKEAAEPRDETGLVPARRNTPDPQEKAGLIPINRNITRRRGNTEIAAVRRDPPAPRSDAPLDTVNRNAPAPREKTDLTPPRPVSVKISGQNDLEKVRQVSPNVMHGAGKKKDKVIMYDVTIEGEEDEERPDTEDETESHTGSPGFKMKYNFDSAYKDVPTSHPIRPRREKRTGCIGGLLYAAFIICISLVLAALLWMAASDVLGFGADDEQITVAVQSGFDMDDLIDKLCDAKLIRYKSLFKLYASYSHAEEKITAGTYSLNKNLDYRSIVHGMTARGGARAEQTVLIPEGFTMADIFKRLKENGVCTSEEEWWDAAANHDFKYSFLDSSTLGDKRRLEGFLFPDTYNFYIDSTPVQAMTIMLREFSYKLTETYIERAEDMGYTINEIITIASMIEREAGNDEERPRIAAVIYNRLNSSDFPFLQIDATIHYAIAGTGIQISTDFDNPYNSYLYEGLPPGPIANPGLASIRAALYPESTDEYYYALNKEGSHYFSSTKAQHDAFVASDEYGG